MQKIDKKYVIELSNKKNEDQKMLNFRLQSLTKFNELDNPNFGPKLDINFNYLLQR